MASAKNSAALDLAARIKNAESKSEDTKPISSATNGSKTTPAKKTAPAAAAKKTSAGAKKTAPVAKKAAASKEPKETKAEKAEKKEGLDAVIAGLKSISKLNAAQLKTMRKRLEGDSTIHRAAEDLSALAIEVAEAREGKRAVLSIPEELATLLADSADGPELPALSQQITTQENLQAVVKLLTRSDKLSKTRSDAKVPVTSFQLDESWTAPLKEALEAFNAKREKNRSASGAADLADISSRDLAAILVEACSPAEEVPETADELLVSELSAITKHLKK